MLSTGVQAVGGGGGISRNQETWSTSEGKRIAGDGDRFGTEI